METEKEELKLLREQLERTHVIIMCLIAFLSMCALLIFTYFYNSDIEMTKEIVKIESNENGDAIYQRGNNNKVERNETNEKVKE